MTVVALIDARIGAVARPRVASLPAERERHAALLSALQAAREPTASQRERFGDGKSGKMRRTVRPREAQFGINLEWAGMPRRAPVRAESRLLQSWPRRL